MAKLQKHVDDVAGKVDESSRNMHNFITELARMDPLNDQLAMYPGQVPVPPTEARPHRTRNRTTSRARTRRARDLWRGPSSPSEDRDLPYLASFQVGIAIGSQSRQVLGRRAQI